MIRTLLIDNYDSFTFNLYHYLAQVNGCVPVVVPNDWDEWDLERLRDFDNVVISPGPGAPTVERDFGISAQVIEDSWIPVLGICLGHQGIASVCGGRVSHAPQPMHGRVSEIFHSGNDLFDGIPTPFRAVRYHSLAVSRVPSDLKVTARTADGVVMGLRHRTRPLWGVQFHPESVATEHGLTLLRNFAELTGPGRARPRPATPPPVDRAPAQTYRLHVRKTSLTCSDEQLFEAVFGDQERSVWLDGNQLEHEDSRFSIMGAPTGSLAAVVAVDAALGTIAIEDRGGRREIESDFYTWLERDMADRSIIAPELPFDFRLGWVGYLGYELGVGRESGLGHRSPLPDAMLMFLDRALVVDHAEQQIYLLSLEPTEQAQSWFAQTIALIPQSVSEPRVLPSPPTLSLRARHSRERYRELIGECQRLITDGETYEVCLTNMLEAEGCLDPSDAYLHLRRQNPTPLGAYLRTPQVSVLSTSPERFLRISNGGRVQSKPIKGTRPRGGTPEEDLANLADLHTSEKDRSENLMIVDLVRHDLGRTAAVGSVKVDRLFDVESYATVHQLVSTVSSQLAAEASPVQCVKAAFPPGSMTGAPKLRTMRIIDRLELGARGIYSGAVGYFSLNGAVDLSVLIRTVVAVPDRVQYGVGGAIVALSDAEAEYQETVTKAAPLLKLLGDAAFPQRGARE